MFESLKAWCTGTINLYRFSGKSMSGDSSYASAEELACYIAYKDKQITDKHGKEYISNTQVYIECSPPVTVTDKIALPDGPSIEIRQLGGFMDGNTGKMSIQVIYL